MAMSSEEEMRRIRGAKWVAVWITGIIIFFLLIILLALTLTSGCVNTERAKVAALDAISPFVVLKGSAQYEKMFPANTSNVTVGNVSVFSNVSTVIIKETATVTPELPVTVLPTSDANYVDPYAEGTRQEYQWFRWHWDNVSGLQQADRGIVVYNHYWLNSFTYWDDAWGNYYKQYPDPGMRFVAVFVHQEDFNEDNSGLWGYQNHSFYIQYNNELHSSYPNFNQVYRIAELEEKYGNYYSSDFIHPYGTVRVYGGTRDASTGGYHLEFLDSLWSGPSNSWDGYLIFEVPVDMTDSDIRIVGNFAGKNVNWIFSDSYHAMRFPAERNQSAAPRPATGLSIQPTQTIARG
jgi:hypothetical protein